MTDRGLRFDRRWMLVNADGGFITQRTVPEMALIRVALGPDGLQVTSGLHPDPLFVPYTPAGSCFGAIPDPTDLLGIRPTEDASHPLTTTTTTIESGV